jgi:hypothetical protein
MKRQPSKQKVDARAGRPLWPIVLAGLACLATGAYAHAQNSNGVPGTQSTQQTQTSQDKENSKAKKKDKQNDDQESAQKEKEQEKAAGLPAVLWMDRGDISQLDMIGGEGGAKDFPDPNMIYTFVEEDMSGTSTKFRVTDADGEKWLVKLGVEAQPETAATRFVWAMGYFTDIDYFEPEIHVRNLPKLKRDMHGADPKTGIVPNVRLKLEGEGSKKIANWSWYDNPFSGTREFNGLRVMMALLNNWDLKTDNNKVYVLDRERRFVVSDLGASFGKSGDPIHDPLHLPISHATKGNLSDYESSKFIRDETTATVSFDLRTGAPFYIRPFKSAYFSEYKQMETIEDDIPVADARWIGARLAQLTQKQLVDAFRAAGYIPQEAEAFAMVVQKRIVDLNHLPGGTMSTDPQ